MESPSLAIPLHVSLLPESPHQIFTAYERPAAFKSFPLIGSADLPVIWGSARTPGEETSELTSSFPAAKFLGWTDGRSFGSIHIDREVLAVLDRNASDQLPADLKASQAGTVWPLQSTFGPPLASERRAASSLTLRVVQTCIKVTLLPDKLCWPNS